MPKPPVPLSQLRDVQLLIASHHPLIGLETVEEGRVAALLEEVSVGLEQPYFVWTANSGLRRVDQTLAIHGTKSPLLCLEHIRAASIEAVYHLKDFSQFLGEPKVQSAMLEALGALSRCRSAIVLSEPELALSPSVEAMITRVELDPITEDEYYEYTRSLLAALRTRMSVEMTLTGEDVAVLLQQLKGLTFFEVKRVLSQAIVEHQRLDRSVLEKVRAAKRQAIERTGILDFIATETDLSEVAGLDTLKAWLRQRKVAFTQPERARSFGLQPPRGVLLLGVQGCGKSLCAKAVSHEWELPLIRFDPSRIYAKYVGESERNLNRAIRVAESLSPIVFWIDELEKAFAGGGAEDGGVSTRILGSFLTWLQEKRAPVFVIATSNDVSKLPAELLRKGRFDEIFFVDLPNPAEREAILKIHLTRRGRDPAAFDLPALSSVTDGFSGAELEQVVVAALYEAFAADVELGTQHLVAEALRTRPLSVTAERAVSELRAWASGRTVPAT
ncbi:MAG: AAA family ATPase [Polyangiaceae bacterium]|nr:AAA family ATPase [Polyangiaceae bacterium]MCW5790392.1 AAA family ATPase [Polyangiaceae bacterium]